MVLDIMIACVSIRPPSISITKLSLEDQIEFGRLKLQERFSCAKCSYLMLEVKQLQDCGHLVCSGCADE